MLVQILKIVLLDPPPEHQPNDHDRRLQRHLPPPAQSLVSSAVAELAQPQYSAALALMNAARDAFDDRPRRERDACANAFDALESMPHETFGRVMANARQQGTIKPETIRI